MDVTNIESRKESARSMIFCAYLKFSSTKQISAMISERHHNKEIKMLLENEIYIEEPLASGCIFNPDGIHRGGFSVKEVKDNASIYV